MQHVFYSTAWWIQHLRLVVVGVLTGVVAVAFRTSLESAVEWRHWSILQTGPVWVGLLASVAFSLATILPAVALVAWFCPEAAGSGIPQVKALARHPLPIHWARLLLVKFTSGVLGIGGGLALGREGPTIQLGSALGELVSTSTHCTPGERRQLLLLGASAGLAGAFNAPLAGALFVFEELSEEFKPSTVATVLFTTFTADWVGRALTGQTPQLGAFMGPPPSLLLLPYFLLLGWFGGVLGVGFNQLLLLSLRLSRWIRERFGRWWLPFFVALLVGVLGWLDTRWIGGGEALLREVRRSGMELNVLLALFALRAVLTLVGYSVGAAGGLFAPLLVLGGLLGSAFAEATGQPDPIPFLLVGIAALFTGVVRAPLTGILLMLEMAGALSLLFPLGASCLLAKFTADALGDRPVYDALLEDVPLTPAPLRSPGPD